MNLVVEFPFQDGWNDSIMVKGIKENKVILIDGQEIEFEKLRVKEIDFASVIFVVDERSDSIMDKKNETKQIYMVCDGNPIQFESEHSAKEICNFISMTKGSSGMVEIKEGIYVDPSKVSIIKDAMDTEVVLKIDGEELGRVAIDAINKLQSKNDVQIMI